jgi:hypothetical protein
MYALSLLRCVAATDIGDKIALRQANQNGTSSPNMADPADALSVLQTDAPLTLVTALPTCSDLKLAVVRMHPHNQLR